MPALKAQYFFSFAILGCLLPYIPVYLHEQALGEAQLGYVVSMSGVAIMFSPVVMALLADAHLQSRTLLAWMFGLSALALVGVWWASGFWPLLAAYGLFWLAFIGTPAVQDGLNFRVQARREADGQPRVAYHRIRVWGTVGFMVPSLAIYGLLTWGGASVGVILPVALVLGLAGLANAALLPRVANGAAPPLSAAKSGGAAGEEEADEGAELDAPPAPPAAGLPTLAAARAMLEPSMLVFLVAVWLCMLAKAAYYAFFPLYLTRQLGVPMQWVGLILSVGVLIEIFFMLGFGRLLRLLGLRGLMAVGAACDALRLALLFAYPNIYVAVGTQVFHGMSVLVVHVAPQIYLNHRAGERYRSSMQGLYCVAVLGSGQILGAALGGLVAQGTSLVTVFGLGAALGVAAAALFAIAFRDRPAMAEMAA